MQFNSHSQESSRPNGRLGWRRVCNHRSSRSLPGHHNPSLATCTTSPSTAAYFPTGSNLTTLAAIWFGQLLTDGCELDSTAVASSETEAGQEVEGIHTSTHTLSSLHTATDTHPNLRAPSSTPTSLILISTDTPHLHQCNLHWNTIFRDHWTKRTQETSDSKYQSHCDFLLF